MISRRQFSVFAISAACLPVLAGCGIYGIGNPGVEDVAGRWRETTKGAGTNQGFVFTADGKASSFGTPKTVATKYMCYRGYMELEGYDVADDGRMLRFKRSFIVEQPDDNVMIWKDGLDVRTFVRE